MGLNGIPKANSHWVDEAFRVLRRLNKLEYSIMVLLTAEITAMVYYKALRKGIKSKILRIICDQILKDEVEHIKFQCFTLWKLYNRRNNFRKKRIRLFHRMLILGTKLIVWHYHKPVFRLGRLNLKTFSQNISKEYDRADKMIKGVIEIDYVVAP